jgi:hypothetical protein
MSCNNVNVEPVVIGGGDGSTAYDAFGRLRVSNPLTLFDSNNVMSKGTQFDESLTGSGTVSYTSAKSTVNLNVTTASGDKVIRQSKRVMSYQPGKSLLFLATFVMNAQTENLIQKVGIFDANNGIFFKDTGTEYQIVRRTYTSGSSVDAEEIGQSSWNGDKLDGTGPSGYTLHPDKATILFMDFEWLGMGSVRVGFVIDGKFIVAHTFKNANSLSTVYMQTANLPIRYEIETTGTLASSATLQQVCCTCMSEGGYYPSGVTQLVRTADIATGVNLSTTNTFYNLATIRIKSGRPYAVIVPSGVDVLNISNNDFEFGLFLGATPSSPFSYTSYSDDVEYDLTTVDLTSIGTQIACGYLGGKTAPSVFGGADFINWAYQLGQTIAGVSDILTLAVRSGSPNGKCAVQLKWLNLT